MGPLSPRRVVDRLRNAGILLEVDRYSEIRRQKMIELARFDVGRMAPLGVH